MKIIHSFWTKPTFKKDTFYIDRNAGGWVDRKYNYMSWALSCLQFKKFYEKVELVTDRLGYDLLINRMGLPYSKVDVVLDDLNDYHVNLWAVGKIYAYQIQDEPFMHVDGDVYIWERLDNEFENSPLFAQHIEKQFQFYDDLLEGVQKHFSYVPEVLAKYQAINGSVFAANAGVFGGTNLEFFKDYTQEAFNFIDRNIAHLEKIQVGMFNTLYEQALFYAMAQEQQQTIRYLVPNVNENFDGLMNFTGIPNHDRYVHTLSRYKLAPQICEYVADRLLLDHPEYYYRIIQLLRANHL